MCLIMILSLVISFEISQATEDKYNPSEVSYLQTFQNGQSKAVIVTNSGDKVLEEDIKENVESEKE